jgi:pimeloyl-ACP methyl ester carboxylesterase
MAEWTFLRRDGVRLGCCEFGGVGPAFVLLHGLAGHAGDVSCAARVADAGFAIERLQLAPAVVVGQSLGGLTALLLAADRPDQTRGGWPSD